MKHLTPKAGASTNYPRKPPPLRAARLRDVQGENGRIVTRYVEAIEDAKAEGKLTQSRINERFGA